MNDNSIKSFKTALEKEKWNNVFLSQIAEMAAIEFDPTFFINFEKHKIEMQERHPIHDKETIYFH